MKWRIRACKRSGQRIKRGDLIGRRREMTQSVIRSPGLLHGRGGFRLFAHWGHVSVLEGGGHICELNLKACDGVNPLWNPPWKTIDPHKYKASRHAPAYGAPPDARLLAGIAGHNLCLDHFGPPSAQETAAGRTTHGEASILKWRQLRTMQAPEPTLEYGATLEEAQIQIRRKLSLDRNFPVVYCEETASNLSGFDRPISWVQHVTFGPPFVECGRTIFDMSATRGKVCSLDFGSRLLLKPDAEFTWPFAPSPGRRRIDLRRMSRGRYGRFTAQLMDAKRKYAFIAASNPRLSLLAAYVFRRADFPWVGNWEERYSRRQPPWSGKTLCRGLEFGTTPFPVTRQESIRQGTLFGESTYRWLPAKSQVKARYLILLFKIPEDFRGTSRVELAGRTVHIVETARGREFTVPVRGFL
jgi:hypothetical protein